MRTIVQHHEPIVEEYVNACRMFGVSSAQAIVALKRWKLRPSSLSDSTPRRQRTITRQEFLNDYPDVPPIWYSQALRTRWFQSRAKQKDDILEYGKFVHQVVDRIRSEYVDPTVDLRDRTIEGRIAELEERIAALEAVTLE